MKIEFNVDPEVVLASEKRKIVFVHVGKCAGESIMAALRTRLPDDYTMFEMHCFDANKRIRTLVESGADDISYIVAKRDPVARFVSAFNWDKHNLLLSGRLAGTGFDESYRMFPSAETLVQGTASETESVREAALKFMRFAHMGMGQSWYTPSDIVAELPRSRTMVCEVRTLRQDLEAVLSRFDIPAPEPGWVLPNLKAGFAETYPDADTLFDRRLSASSKEMLKELIAQDIHVYELLSSSDWK